MAWKVAAVKLPCKWNHFWKGFMISSLALGKLPNKEQNTSGQNRTPPDDCFCYVESTFGNFGHIHINKDCTILFFFIPLRELKVTTNSAQKMKFSNKDLFGKCDQIRSFSIHFCAVNWLIVSFGKYFSGSHSLPKSVTYLMHFSTTLPRKYLPAQSQQ